MSWAVPWVRAATCVTTGMVGGSVAPAVVRPFLVGVLVDVVVDETVVDVELLVADVVVARAHKAPITTRTLRRRNREVFDAHAAHTPYRP